MCAPRSSASCTPPRGTQARAAPGDGTPNLLGMMSREAGLLAPLPQPRGPPVWLGVAELEAMVASFGASGFRGGLNFYRNLDRNWELQAALRGRTVDVPALYLAGERDPGLAMPGMRQIDVGAMPELVPALAGSHIIAGAGHWLQQERPEEVNAYLVPFLRAVLR